MPLRRSGFALDLEQTRVVILHIFINNILPAFMVIGGGALLGRILSLEVRTPSRMTLYFFVPCLVFTSLTKSTVGEGDVTNILLFLVLVTGLIGAVSWGVARSMRLNQAQENALLLSTMFLNAGNLGLPILLFAYGQEGMDRGIVLYVGSALLAHTAAAYFASRGRASIRHSILNTLKLPTLYAILLAFILRGLHIAPPEFLFKAINLASGAAIPTLLFVLGIQLSQTKLRGDFRLIGVATGIKLLVAPALAFLLATLMGLEGLTYKVCVFEASTPAAITAALMAIEFDNEPEFVTSVVFLTTLLSSISLTVILGILG